jgi:hypothetical protein
VTRQRSWTGRDRESRPVRRQGPPSPSQSKEPVMRIVPTPTLDCDPAEDRAITAEELEALRLWIRGDMPFPDEPPQLDEPYEPTAEDLAWLARQEDEVPEWFDLESMTPRELSDDRTDALSGWAADAMW